MIDFPDSNPYPPIEVAIPDRARHASSVFLKMPAPKIKAELEIPADLVAFLRIVCEMINLGLANDESDDGIQIPEFLTCGGLWDKKRGIYGFTHYLELPPANRYWEIQLDIETIASIASGEKILFPDGSVHIMIATISTARMTDTAYYVIRLKVEKQESNRKLNLREQSKLSTNATARNLRN